MKVCIFLVPRWGSYGVFCDCLLFYKPIPAALGSAEVILEMRLPCSALRGEGWVGDMAVGGPMGQKERASPWGTLI